MSLIKLWPRQQDAFEFVLGQPEALLYCEQRTGKTYITLKLLEAIIDDDFCGVLVTLLNNKETTWLDKAQEFLPHLALFTDWELFKRHRGARLLVVHYEQFTALAKYLRRYKQLTFAAIDEGHRLANRTSKASKAASALSWVPRKLLMTGTPFDKTPASMWAQFRFAVPGLFGARWKDFEDRYMEYPKLNFENMRPGSMAWQQKMIQQRILKGKAKFRDDRRAEFVKLIRPHCYRLEKEDVGIKRAIIERIDVPVVGRQRRLYNAMKNTGVVHIGGQSIMSPLPVTKVMKLRQLASGFLFDEEGALHVVGDAKLDRLVDLFHTLPKPIVVFTAFTPDTDRVASALKDEGYDIAVVQGRTKKRDRPAIWRAFQRAQYDGVVCQIKTGGVGVDLWKANNAIVHSMGHSFIDWDQAASRLDAITKRKNAKVYVLCGENTIDTALYDLVISKHLNGASVLRHLKRSLR